MAIHLGRSLPNASRDRPERRRGRPARPRQPKPTPPAAPTWSCSRWGLPCRRRCRRRGALLPHHFTLAARRPEGRTGLAVCFCGTFPGVAPAGRYPAPCLRGARTFLPPLGEPGGERPSDRLTGMIWDGAPRLSNARTGASCLTAKERSPLLARGSGARPGRSRRGGRPGSAARRGRPCAGSRGRPSPPCRSAASRPGSA
jgi:hypothetical protein